MHIWTTVSTGAFDKVHDFPARVIRKYVSNSRSFHTTADLEQMRPEPELIISSTSSSPRGKENMSWNVGIHTHVLFVKLKRKKQGPVPWLVCPVLLSDCVQRLSVASWPDGHIKLIQKMEQILHRPCLVILSLAELTNFRLFLRPVGNSVPQLFFYLSFCFQSHDFGTKALRRDDTLVVFCRNKKPRTSRAR